MAVTLNGRAVHGVTIEPATRKGMDTRITYAIAVIREKSGGKREKVNLAACLKGSRALEEVLDKYTADTYTETRALELAEDFAKNYPSVPLMEDAKERLGQIRAEIAKREAEAKDAEKGEGNNGEKGEGEKGEGEKGEGKAKAKRKTLAEKLSAVLNKENGALVKCEALITCLAVYNAAAAAAARNVLAGEAVKAAEALAAKAKREAEEARKMAETTARR